MDADASRRRHGAAGAVRDYAVQVLACAAARPATIALYAKLLRLAILPTFGALPVAEITAGQVTAWYATQKSTPTQQDNAYGLLKSILAEAVVDGLIPANLCRVKAGWANELKGTN